LFIIQKNTDGGNASICMVVLLFSDTISKRKLRQPQLYLLTCRKYYLLLWTYLMRTCMNKCNLILQCIACPGMEKFAYEQMP